MKTKLFKSLTLSLLMFLGVGNLWGYTISGTSLVFAEGEKLTIDFSEAVGYYSFEDAGKLNANKIEKNGNLVIITFRAKTIKQNDEMFHWQGKDGGSYSWQHDGKEWFCLSGAAASATGSIPLPNINDATYLKVTSATYNGACTFTWVGGTPAPEPEPEGDPAIDGCDGCYKITE